MQPLTPLPLRQHILSELSSLPGKRELQLVVLVTPPKRTSGLYPYASRPRVKSWVQEVLLLLFERVPDTRTTTTSDPTSTDEQARSSEAKDGGTTGQAGQGGRKACIAALEAYLHLLPTTQSCILYISKLDSSGLALPPSPTSLLARSFLSHLCSPLFRPSPSVWVHVFARAQGQYLFPTSSENGRKRVLGDTRLCAWWKGVLEGVVRGVVPESAEKPRAVVLPLASSEPGAGEGTRSAEEQGEEQGNGEGEGERRVESAALHIPAASHPPKYAAFYLLPGYGELEAARLLAPSSASVPSTTSPGKPPINWTYGHPYTPLNPFPFPSSAAFPPPSSPSLATDPFLADGAPSASAAASTPASASASASASAAAASIANLIPAFEDDPKTRFVQELASDVQPLAVGPRKRQRTGVGPVPGSPVKRRKVEAVDEDMLRDTSRAKEDSGENGSPEGGERAGREKEKDAGKEQRREKEKEKEKEKEDAPTAEERALSRISIDEFWELMPHRQECSSGAVTAFFVLVFPPPSPSSSPSPSPPPPPSTAPSPSQNPAKTNGTPSNLGKKHPAAPIGPALKSDDPSPPPKLGQVLPSVLARIRSRLLDLEFGNVEAAYRSSSVLEDLVRSCCAVVPHSQPQSQPQPQATAGPSGPGETATEEKPGGVESGAIGERGEDMYTQYVCASVLVDNPPLARREVERREEARPAVINVLQVKRKKRPAA